MDETIPITMQMNITILRFHQSNEQSIVKSYFALD